MNALKKDANGIRKLNNSLLLRHLSETIIDILLKRVSYSRSIHELEFKIVLHFATIFWILSKGQILANTYFQPLTCGLNELEHSLLDLKQKMLCSNYDEFVKSRKPSADGLKKNFDESIEMGSGKSLIYKA